MAERRVTVEIVAEWDGHDHSRIGQMEREALEKMARNFLAERFSGGFIHSPEVKAKLTVGKVTDA